ncbi:hypothetical protein BASA81_006128 [Batrachochytrium salamandrivorans]|nr:hypothetical protein BASA81_006128 [Batrachochytrium salamandrivorans]
MNFLQKAGFFVFFSFPFVVGPVIDKNIRKAKCDFSEGLLKATLFATAKHGKQTRKNLAQDPYITHPIRVSMIIASLGHSADNLALMQAGLLHDTVEDTNTTFEEIEREFGTKVRALVAEHTDDKTLAKAERKRMQIVKASSLSGDARILVLSDKIANLEDLLLQPNGEGIPVGWDVNRVQNYVAWAQKVCQATMTSSSSSEDVKRMQLVMRIHELCNCQFQYSDGQMYPALPADPAKAPLV